jgi:hypothetical protein
MMKQMQRAMGRSLRVAAVGRAQRVAARGEVEDGDEDEEVDEDMA